MYSNWPLKNQATQFLPVKAKKNQYVGRATREKEMAIALFQVEMKLVAAAAHEEAQTESWKESTQYNQQCVYMYSSNNLNGLPCTYYYVYIHVWVHVHRYLYLNWKKKQMTVQFKQFIWNKKNVSFIFLHTCSCLLSATRCSSEYFSLQLYLLTIDDGDILHFLYLWTCIM